MTTIRPKSETKLPLVVRKNSTYWHCPFVQLTQGHTLDSCNLSIVRDNWDPVKPEVESKISAILGTAWVIDFDTGLAWEHGQDGDSRYAKENPGKMLAE